MATTAPVRVAFLVSDHGFGHAARMVAVMRKVIPLLSAGQYERHLEEKEEEEAGRSDAEDETHRTERRKRRARDEVVLIISDVPSFFFIDNLGALSHRVRIVKEKMSVGLMQLSSMSFDLDSTIAKLDEYWEPQSLESKINRICEEVNRWRHGVESKQEQVKRKQKEMERTTWHPMKNPNGEKGVSPIDSNHADVNDANLDGLLEGNVTIVFDSPAIAPLVAQRLQLPSLAITNFGFNFIYGEFVGQDERFRKYVQVISEAYRAATAALVLPYACDNLSCFPCPRVPLNSWLGLTTSHHRDRNRKNLFRIMSTANSKIKRGVDGEIVHNEHSEKEAEEETKVMLMSFGGHASPLRSVEDFEVQDFEQ